MIHVRLAGGLGNQLFQLAAAALVESSPKVGMVAHTAALSRYSQTRQPDALRLIPNVIQNPPGTSSLRRLWAWFVVSARAGRWLPIVGISDRRRSPLLAGVGPRDIAIIDGYFQRGWTDDSLATAIRHLAPRPPSDAAQKRLSAGECVVHIRGGDFLLLPAYRVTSVEFYACAMHMAVEAGFDRFAIMTDDPGHAERIREGVLRRVPDISARLMEPAGDALTDFDTLRTASARVIGNSTFAWWATALSMSTAPTWSPTEFLCGEPRDYFLPTEIPVSTATLSREADTVARKAAAS